MYNAAVHQSEKALSSEQHNALLDATDAQLQEMTTQSVDGLHAKALQGDCDGGTCHVVQGGLKAGGLVREELAADEGVCRLNDLKLWVRHQSDALKDTDCSDDQRCRECTQCQPAVASFYSRQRVA